MRDRFRDFRRLSIGCVAGVDSHNGYASPSVVIREEHCSSEGLSRFLVSLSCYATCSSSSLEKLRRWMEPEPEATSGTSPRRPKARRVITGNRSASSTGSSSGSNSSATIPWPRIGIYDSETRQTVRGGWPPDLPGEVGARLLRHTSSFGDIGNLPPEVLGDHEPGRTRCSRLVLEDAGH